MPLLSIITINKNDANGLLQTIVSVIGQTFTDYEYIIIDGASKDESVTIIQKHADKIAYWISEPDTGIYNAMNKGIAHARGMYCLFLNAGDVLTDHTTLDAVFASGLKAEIMAGSVRGKQHTPTLLQKPPEKFRLSELYYKNIPHQAEFIQRSLFERIGTYNEKYRILADYDFNIRAMLHDVSFVEIPLQIAWVDLSGISNDPANITVLESEKETILKTNIPAGILEDYVHYNNKNTYRHAAIEWLLGNSFMWKITKTLYRLLKA